MKKRMIRTKEELLNAVEEFIDQLTPEHTKMITQAEVRKMMGCSAPTLRKIIREDPSFPRPLVLGYRIKRFALGDVEEWIKTHRMK